MNKRIQELVEQADLKAIIDDAYQERGDWQPFVDKFAELIVRKCARMADCERNRDPGRFILQHFGVEP